MRNGFQCFSSDNPGFSFITYFILMQEHFQGDVLLFAKPFGFTLLIIQKQISPKSTKHEPELCLHIKEDLENLQI